jgi:maleylpyruvate isomerase
VHTFGFTSFFPPRIPFRARTRPLGENDVMPLPPMPVPTPRPTPPHSGAIPDRPVRPVNPPAAVAIHALAAATDRLLATIDAMPAAAFAEPSVLPGWSRAHVLAHLALNAKGLTGVLTTLGQDDPLPMYVSGARRDADIEQLAAQPPARIADRVAVGSSMLAAHLGGGPAPEDALEAVGRSGRNSGTRTSEASAAREAGAGTHGPGGGVISVFAHAAAEADAAIRAWSVSGTFDRVIGGPAIPAAEIPYMRRREVEIHHADLNLGYSPRDWAPEFAVYLLAVTAFDRDGEASMTLQPDGLDPLLLSGPDGDQRDLEVRGPAADLAWWLAGRGAGESLTATGGALPVLRPWVPR